MMADRKGTDELAGLYIPVLLESESAPPRFLPARSPSGLQSLSVLSHPDN